MSYIRTNNTEDVFHPEHTANCLLGHPGFSDDLLCAEIARLSYIHADKNQQAKTGLDAIGFTESQWISNDNNQALLVWNPTSTTGVIAFRGTQPDDLNDILADANVWLIDHSAAHNENHPYSLADIQKKIIGLIKRDPIHHDHMGKVHKGFHDAFISLQPQIENWTTGRNGSWLITGHSLGAAMATVAATVLSFSKSVITFGSPRVGDKNFANAFNRSGISSRRYVDCCDIVCRVPLDIPLIFEYCHVQNEHYIDSEGVIHRDHFDHQKYADESQILARGLTDHAPLNYVRALASHENYQLNEQPAPNN